MNGAGKSEQLLTPVTPDGQVGVIVGRFQVPYLTEAHHNLIKTVASKHKRVLIIMGTKAQPTTKDPLDFETRVKLVQEHYPDVMCLPLADTKYDDVWVDHLEALIRQVLPTQSCVLYGGRDSFVTIYRDVYTKKIPLGQKPKFPTVEFEEFGVYISGTQLREEAANSVLAAEAFRTGVIYATMNRFSPIYPTVDVAVLNPERDALLLGKRKNEKKFRFFGGHVEKRHGKVEMTVVHEASEESHACLFWKALTFIGSTVVDDWRYRGTPEGIITMFFEGVHGSGGHGPVYPGDDIDDKVQWFKFHELREDLVEPEHIPLMQMFMEKHAPEIEAARAEWAKAHPEPEYSAS